jgi:hypothetical protein
LESASKLDHHAFGPIAVGNQTDMKLFFTLCRRFNTSSTSFCNTPRIGLGQTRNDFVVGEMANRGKNLVSYACIEHEDLSFDMGHNVAYSPLLTPSTKDVDITKRGDGFQLQMNSKEACMAISDEEESAAIVKSKEKTLSTVIDFVCNPKVGRGQPVLQSPPASLLSLLLSCNVNLKWETVSACPICTKFDYEEVLGECKDDGYRYATYYPKSNSRCNPYGHLPSGIDGSDILPPLIVQIKQSSVPSVLQMISNLWIRNALVVRILVGTCGDIQRIALKRSVISGYLSLNNALVRKLILAE